MSRPRAFVLGVREFRSDLTTHFDYPLIETYDLGRDLAHRLTLRHWDQSRSTNLTRGQRLMLSVAERLVLRVADRTLSEQVDDALRHALADMQRAIS